MKKILAQYPSVFYQILLLFVLGEICFTCSSFDLSALYNIFEVHAPNNYKPLIISTLYITAGLIVDKIRDFKKGILLSVFLFVIGMLSTSLGFELDQYLSLFGNILSYLAHCIFVLLCILHVGLLFPIANDWKDNAFLFLLVFPFLFEITYFFFLGNNTDIITYYYSISFHLFFIIIGVIIFLTFKFKNLGFKIEMVEEDAEEEIKEEKFIHFSMIGCLLVTFIFSFATKNLVDLGVHKESINGLLYPQNNSIQITFFILVFAFIIFRIAFLKSAKYQSNHFNKLNFLSIFLLVIAGLEYYLGKTESIFLHHIYLFSYQLLFVPIILSIMTHLNLDKKIGLWLGVFFAIPFLVNQIKTFVFLEETITKALPYVAILLLILFVLVFRENRKFLEKKLALTEPNRTDGDEENDIDLIEHFLEK